MSRRTTNVALGLTSTAVAVLMAEVLIRFSGIPGYQPFVRQPIPSIEPHDVLGWFNVPDTDEVIPWGPRQVRVAHNSLGFRDQSMAPAPSGGRVLVLGDSFAYGFGVDQAELATELLDRALPDVDIVNMGVNGFSTDQSLLLLEDQGHRLKPTVVLLMAFSNDQGGNMLKVNYHRYPKPRFVLEAGGKLRLEQTGPLPLSARWLTLGQEHSALFSAIAFHLRTAKIFPLPQLQDAVWRARGNLIDSAATLAALIEALDAQTREFGARLGIVIAVSQRQVVQRTDVEFRRLLAEIAEKRSLPLLNLAVSFERHLAAPSAVELELSWDRHWSPAAHKLVAQELEMFMRTQLLSTTDADGQSEIILVQNWHEELKRLVPVD